MKRGNMGAVQWDRKYKSRKTWQLSWALWKIYLEDKHFHISTLHKSLEKEQITKGSKLNFSSGVDDNSELKLWLLNSCEKQYWKSLSPIHIKAQKLKCAWSKAVWNNMFSNKPSLSLIVMSMSQQDRKTIILSTSN